MTHSSTQNDLLASGQNTVETKPEITSNEPKDIWQQRMKRFLTTELLLQKIERWRVISGTLFMLCFLILCFSSVTPLAMSPMAFLITLTGLGIGLVTFPLLYLWINTLSKHRNKLSSFFYKTNHEVEFSNGELKLINRGNYNVSMTMSLKDAGLEKESDQTLSPFASKSLFLSGIATLTVLLLLPMDALSQLVVSYTIIAFINYASRVATSYHKYRNFFRLFALLLGIAITLRYIFWRGMYTLGTDDWISLPAILLLFAAELYTAINYMIGCFVNVFPLIRPELTLDDIDEADIPTVDVMIPSYNEGIDLLENTLRAAKILNYPKHKLKVHLLDDGGTEQKVNQADPEKAEEALTRRHSLMALCQELGVIYHTREKNLHAKAGNINSALKETDGDLIVILDADHVPTTDFLYHTVPWMVRDDKVFLVQTPHFMANPDAVERNYFAAFTRMPQETDMFYGTIQKGLDFWSSSFFCGSAAVLRRKYLAELGGISVDTITEDAETALTLHAKGYKSVYLSRTMVSGLAPETTDAFITQRMRWAQGMTQILLLKRKQLFHDIPWYQTLGYLSSILFWLFPFARITFLIMPLAYLVFGLNIYNASILDIFAFTIPHVIATYMISNMLFGRTRWPLVSEIYEMLQCAFTFTALIKVFRNPRAPSFVVTPKGENLDKDYISPVSGIFYWMLLATVIAFIMGILKFASDPLTWPLTTVVLVWNTFNLILLLGILNVLLEKRQIRQQARIPAYDDIMLKSKSGESWKGNLVDISTNGAKLDLQDKDAPIPDDVVLVGWLGSQQRYVELPIKILHHDPASGTVRLIFNAEDDETKNLVIGYTLGNSDRWQAFQRRRTRKIRYLFGMRHALKISLRTIINHFWMQIKTVAQKSS